jgi:hypothetical protein
LTIVPVLAGLGVGIALIVLLSIFFTPSTSSIDKAIVCRQSIEKVKEMVKMNESFVLLLPTKLPKGYSLQSADYVPTANVILEYFTRSLCNPRIPYSPEEGVIDIVEGSLADVTYAKSGEEYVKMEMAKYEASNINATSYELQNGRLYGIGYWDNTYLKAALWVVDDKTSTIVRISARSLDTPLERLVVIAESLKDS